MFIFRVHAHFINCTVCSLLPLFYTPPYGAGWSIQHLPPAGGSISFSMLANPQPFSPSRNALTTRHSKERNYSRSTYLPRKETYHKQKRNPDLQTIPFPLRFDIFCRGSERCLFLWVWPKTQRHLILTLIFFIIYILFSPGRPPNKTTHKKIR